MATKGQIAEQVLRIVNGGALTDDSKVTMQEVGVLMEHERDALIRKTILENATLGEHEIPSEFLSVHVLEMYNDTSGVYGAGGRPYVVLPQMPVNLPQDGSIYRVCRVNLLEGHGKLEEWSLTAQDILYSSDTNFSSSSYIFSKSTATGEIGNRFVFNFQYGLTTATVKSYSFTFDYYNKDGKIKGGVTADNINMQELVHSLQRNADFNDFLFKNDLIFYSNYDGGANMKTNIYFQSYNKDFSLGVDNSNNMDIKSLLTGDSVVTITSTNNPNEGGDFAEGAVDVVPQAGLSVQINYPRNKRIYGLEADSLGVKGKDSTTLTMSVFIDLNDLRTTNYGQNDGVIQGVSDDNLVKMFMNKYSGILKIYGIDLTWQSNKLYFKEMFPLGGFDDVLPSTGLLGTSTAALVSTGDIAESANYNEMHCYTRMPNPGVYSKMYDNAIALSGRKYWYRQLNGVGYSGKTVTSTTAGPDGPISTSSTSLSAGTDWFSDEPQYNTSNNRIYFYGETNFHDPLMVDPKRFTSYVSVWMLSKSASLKFEDQFPLPSDAIVDMIKSLVATFTTMRAAKEDLTNDNVDIT